MWGIIPAAGGGTRIQPLAFSKELLPVGSRRGADGIERPRAVGEYLVERMIAGGVSKICFVISPWKFDILQYFRGNYADATLAYVIQESPAGLCDAVFRALPLVTPDEPVVVGLPDTIWFPADALRQLADDRFSFLLFPVERPDMFDAVATGPDGRIRAIEVKSSQASTRWIWGAFKLPGATLHSLHALWQSRGRRDEYIGTLVNAYLEGGGAAWGVRGGETYVDVGTLNGWHTAMHLLPIPSLSHAGQKPREQTAARRADESRPQAV